MESKEIKNAKRDAEMLSNMMPESMVRDHLKILDPDIDVDAVVPECPERPKLI